LREIDARLADPDFYHAGAADEVAAVLKRRSELAPRVESLEARWLSHYKANWKPWSRHERAQCSRLIQSAQRFDRSSTIMTDGCYPARQRRCIWLTYGADVIKIEDTGDGDYLRDFPPLDCADRSGAQVNPVFSAVNRGKRSLAVNLKNDRKDARCCCAWSSAPTH
jgi:hypothetical protein